MAEAEVAIEWIGDVARAEALAAAISADDPDAFSIDIERSEQEAVLRIRVESGPLRTVRATVDDLLACLAAAEAALDGSDRPGSE